MLTNPYLRTAFFDAIPKRFMHTHTQRIAPTTVGNLKKPGHRHEYSTFLLKFSYSVYSVYIFHVLIKPLYYICSLFRKVIIFSIKQNIIRFNIITRFTASPH